MMVKCEFCDREIHSMKELEDHLRQAHDFNDEELEEYGFDRGLYFESRFKEEAKGQCLP